MLGCSVEVLNGFSNSRLSADSLFTFRFSRSAYNRCVLSAKRSVFPMTGVVTHTVLVLQNHGPYMWRGHLTA